MADRWRAFGWDVHEVDGHDLAALHSTIDALAGYSRRTSWSRDRVRQGRLLHGRPARVALPADGRRSTRRAGERRPSRPAGGGGMRTALRRGPDRARRRDPRRAPDRRPRHMALEPFAERFPGGSSTSASPSRTWSAWRPAGRGGLVPFIYSIATFATLRSYEFIRNGPVPAQPARADRRHRRRLRVRPDGITHYALEDWRCCAPSRVAVDRAGRRGADGPRVRTTRRATGPAYFRLANMGLGTGGSPVASRSDVPTCSATAAIWPSSLSAT